MRNTIQRKIVFDSVNALKNHPTPDEVYAFIKERYPTISRSTVYRNLNLLAEENKILRVRVPDAADRFDFNTERHSHIVCRKCGRVDDVLNAQAIDMSEMKLPDGYEIDDFSLIFFGLCPDCK